MKKILGSLMVVTLVSIVAIGATRAYFTDTDTSTNNTFTSGNFEISVNNNGTSDTFAINMGDISGLMPGDETSPATIKVKNNSSIGAATFGKFTYSGALAEKLIIWDYKVEFYDDGGNPTSRPVDNFIVDGVDQTAAHSFDNTFGPQVTLKEWVEGNGPLDVPGTSWDMEGLKPGYYYVVTFTLRFDPQADNNWQGRTANVGYIVKSTQVDTQAIMGLGLGGSYQTESYVSQHVTPYLTNQI